MVAFLLIRPLIPEPEKLADLGVRLLLTVGVALAIQQLLFALVRRLERWIVRVRPGDAGESRARTLGQMFRNLLVTLVWAGAVIHGLDLLGWDVKPLLAGAGILGVALGFGAQTLVRDLIAGLFILLEDQFAVGDLIEVGPGTVASVEEVSLRFTRLRDFNGYVHYVPNGEMKIVVNRSRGWNRVAVDVLIAADQDLDRALEVCREVVKGMNADPAWKSRLLDPIELWGVESLVGQEVQVRMVIRARPGPDGPEAARELRRRVHLALTDAKVRTRSQREIAITPMPAAGPPRGTS